MEDVQLTAANCPSKCSLAKGYVIDFDLMTRRRLKRRGIETAIVAKIFERD